MASNSRDTNKYQFKVGNKIVHGGITKDLERREAEHQQKWPNGHIKKVGRMTTEGSRSRVGKGEGLLALWCGPVQWIVGIVDGAAAASNDTAGRQRPVRTCHANLLSVPPGTTVSLLAILVLRILRH